MKASRYLKLFAIQLRTSALVAVQYRYDFIVDGIISLFWTFTALAPLLVVFNQRAEIVGWSRGEALLVVGWFTLLQGVLEGAINPSLITVVEHIRKGTLDFVLLKPADAQFLVSTSKFLPWRVTNVIAALAIFVFSFREMGRAPSVAALATAALLFVTSVLILYSLWIITVSLAFYVVKIDNLTYLFTSLFDAARWPASVFPAALKIVFTYVLPLALMTTYPAQAMLGKLTPQGALLPLAGAAVFSAVARWVWTRSIRKYTSASS
ncbi:MAG: ABC-2 family transporter protein [Myxococcaceae bacterium]|nr:ABC-2 family transporter protein [Myxococcaceae bacterium]